MPRFLPSLIAALAFGAAFPIADSALKRIDPFHLTAIRYGLATVAFLGLLWAIEGTRALHPGSRRRMLELFGLGSAGFVRACCCAIAACISRIRCSVAAFCCSISRLLGGVICGCRPFESCLIA